MQNIKKTFHMVQLRTEKLFFLFVLKLSLVPAGYALGLMFSCIGAPIAIEEILLFLQWRPQFLNT